MRSRLAEQLRREQYEEVMRMTPAERVELSARLGEEDLQHFIAASGLSREEAIAQIRRQRQIGRRKSGCMSE